MSTKYSLIFFIKLPVWRLEKWKTEIKTQIFKTVITLSLASSCNITYTSLLSPPPTPRCKFWITSRSWLLFSCILYLPAASGIFPAFHIIITPKHISQNYVTLVWVWEGKNWCNSPILCINLHKAQLGFEKYDVIFLRGVLKKHGVRGHENVFSDSLSEGQQKGGRVGWNRRLGLTHEHYHVQNRELVGSCCITRGAQPGDLWGPAGREGGSGERGYMCICSWFTSWYSRN